MEDKEIFQEFIQKSTEIKETWEVAALFEEEREKFKQESLAYKQEILEAQKDLKKIRHQIDDLKNDFKKLEESKQRKQEEIASLKEAKFKQKIQNDISKLNFEKLQTIDSKKEEVLPKPLESVDIYLKNGTVAKARPVKKIFTDTLYKKYRALLRENKSLRQHLLDLELENSKLKIEVRDFYDEDILKANHILEEK